LNFVCKDYTKVTVLIYYVYRLRHRSVPVVVILLSEPIRQRKTYLG